MQRCYHWKVVISAALAYKSTLLRKEEVLGFSFESQLAHNFETVCGHNTERARTSIYLSLEWNTKSIGIWNADVSKKWIWISMVLFQWILRFVFEKRAIRILNSLMNNRQGPHDFEFWWFYSNEFQWILRFVFEKRAIRILNSLMNNRQRAPWFLNLPLPGFSELLIQGQKFCGTGFLAVCRTRVHLCIR